MDQFFKFFFQLTVIQYNPTMHVTGNFYSSLLNEEYFFVTQPWSLQHISEVLVTHNPVTLPLPVPYCGSSGTPSLWSPHLCKLFSHLPILPLFFFSLNLRDLFPPCRSSSCAPQQLSPSSIFHPLFPPLVLYLVFFFPLLLVEVPTCWLYNPSCVF